MNSKHDINIRNAIICWFITFGYMGIIFFLSSQHSFHLHGLPENADKVVHTFIYIPLAFMIYLSLNRSGLKKSLFAVAFIFAGIYGITDEFHQYFVSGRYASAGDVVADFLGALVGSTGAKYFIKS
ncbi:MAG: VanZ family protein [Nitrospiraceae bacterium]|nr:MAG: VanZ family protein [Nitrospiraceae bacterium]